MKKTKENKEHYSPVNDYRDIPLWGVFIIFSLTIFIFFGGHIFGNYFLWDDFREYFFPTQSLAAGELANGRIPFWNPYSLAGMPFLADIQVGFWYPFNRLLGFSLDNNGMISPWFYQFIIFLHFFIMQINFYIFSRYLKISSFGAVIGAIAFSFSYPIFLHIIHPAIVFHWAWFPLIFYFLKKSLDENKVRNAAIAGLIFGITTLSGHPQISFYFFVILSGYVLWYFISNLILRQIDTKKVIVATSFGVLSIIVAVMIFAIQFLPSNTLAKFTQRSEMDYEKSAENSLKFEQIVTLISPRMFGYYDADNQSDFQPVLQDEYDGKLQPVKNYHYWETAVFFGSIAMILSIIGLFITKKDNFTWFLIVIILFGFFYALGKHSPFHQLFYNLPFFDIFRNPVRMFVFSIFGLALFAGMAFDGIFLYKNKKNQNTSLIITSIIAFIGLFNVLGVTQSISGINSDNLSKSISQSVLPFALILIFFLSLIAVYKLKLTKSIFFGIIAVTLFAELYFQGNGFIQSKIDPKTYYQLPEETASAFKPPTTDSDQFRVKTRIYQPSFMAMNRNQGMISRIYQLEGYNPLVLNNASLPVPWEQVFALLNVRYDIQIDPQTGQPRFVEITNRNGNAWFVNKAKYVDKNKSKEFFANNQVDFIKEVIVHSNKIDIEKINKNAIDSTTKTEIKLTNYEPNEIIYQANVLDDGIIVFSEIYYPDWKAYINDKEVDILEVNYSLRAIEVTKGNHEIKMKYESKDFLIGSILAGLSLILSLVIIFISKK